MPRGMLSIDKNIFKDIIINIKFWSCGEYTPLSQFLINNSRYSEKWSCIIT